MKSGDALFSLFSAYAEVVVVGHVASTTPAMAQVNATAWAKVKTSPKKATPTSADVMGKNTVNMPAFAAGTVLSPVIHSHTVHMLAASA